MTNFLLISILKKTTSEVQYLVTESLDKLVTLVRSGEGCMSVVLTCPSFTVVVHGTGSARVVRERFEQRQDGLVDRETHLLAGSVVETFAKTRKDTLKRKTHTHLFVHS